jgi:hypothetical protein
MELTTMNFKLLSAAAVLALAIPGLTATASFAQVDKGGAVAGGGGPRIGGGGGGGGPRMGGGGAPGPRFNGGGGPRYHGGGGYNRGGGGFIPGAVVGGIIGGALATSGSYYGNSYGYAGDSYYNRPYYGGPYDDGGEVVEVAPSGGDDVAYCMQTYKSYNPRTGTYLGYDGLRHACP